MPGPYGPRRVTYADYTASGRALASSRTSSARRCCRTTPTRTPGDRHGPATQPSARGGPNTSSAKPWAATSEHAVIFSGSGATARDRQLDRHPRAADLDSTAARRRAVLPRAERPVVFIGPYEHHSNELPWRESLADVVTIEEDAHGHIDLAQLEAQLQRHARPAAEDRVVLGGVATSPASSPTRTRVARSCTARRPLVLRLRGGGALREIDMRRRRGPRATRTRSSCRRTSSSVAPARRACSSCGASSPPTACPTARAAAQCATSTRPSTATWRRRAA